MHIERKENQAKLSHAKNVRCVSDVFQVAVEEYSIFNKNDILETIIFRKWNV